MFASLLLCSSLLLYVVASPQGPRGPGRPPGQPRPPSSPPQGPPSNSSKGNTAQSPEYSFLFQYPLPIPQIALPLYSERVDGRTIEFFEITIEAFDQQIYPNLGPAHLVGYNGSSPGPTFHLEKDVESIVRYLNKGSGPAVVHLHGSPSHSPWDGWASDLIQPGQYKDYYYPNNQAGPLWYHDHTDGSTTENNYYGQTGVHIIHDPAEDILGLPNGKYDIPLTIADKVYQSNGELLSPANEVINFYGDIIHVNGQPWPYLSVEPRKYRLRFFDTSVSRPYDLSFVDEDNNPIQVQVIASDGGLFEYPVNTEDVVISMGERYEVVIDFAPFKSSNVTLMNLMEQYDIPAFANTDQVMRFVVGSSISDSSNNGPVPSKLKNINWPANKTSLDHVFNFQHGGDAIWTINGVDFDDINNRILARSPQGTVENWQVNYASGPGVHPVHVHLVNLQIVSRTGGSRGVLPYEAAGLKDVVLLEPGESVEARAVYGPWNGIYTFHCHNTVHEDHMMMDAFNVTRLAELGYKYNSTFDLGDPMDPRFAPRDYSTAAYEPAAIQSVITSLGNLNAYKPATALASAESKFYASAGFPTVSATGTLADPTGQPPQGGPPGYNMPQPRATPAPAPRAWRT